MAKPEFITTERVAPSIDQIFDRVEVPYTERQGLAKAALFRALNMVGKYSLGEPDERSPGRYEPAVQLLAERFAKNFTAPLKTK